LEGLGGRRVLNFTLRVFAENVFVFARRCKKGLIRVRSNQDVSHHEEIIQCMHCIARIALNVQGVP
jgi:hypothetical protein